MSKSIDFVFDFSNLLTLFFIGITFWYQRKDTKALQEQTEKQQELLEKQTQANIFQQDIEICKKYEEAMLGMCIDNLYNKDTENAKSLFLIGMIDKDNKIVDIFNDSHELELGGKKYSYTPSCIIKILLFKKKIELIKLYCHTYNKMMDSITTQSLIHFYENSTFGEIYRILNQAEDK